MIGLVIVTHGRIGEEMLLAATQIVGSFPQALSISIGTDDDMDVCRELILAAVKSVDDGAGVILLTDMFGGTPSNLALSIMPCAKTVVLAGVNLPMLIKLAGLRAQKGMVEVVKEAEEAAHKYIQLVTENLAQKKQNFDE